MDLPFSVVPTQQGINLGVEHGEPRVALLQLLGFFLDLLRTPLALFHPLLALERSDPQLLCFLLDVVNGSPVQHRQQAPPGRQGGDPLRPSHGPGDV